MWTVNSTDVQQAKDRIEHRRAEIQARYAEETSALDAEFAVIETLERAALEFAVKHVPEDLGFASPPSPDSAPSAGGEATGAVADETTTSLYPADEEPAGGDEGNGGFDILKPGSRWRLNRGNRLSNPEGAASGGNPTNW